MLEGVNLDTQPAVGYLIAFCDGGYTTNLPLADVRVLAMLRDPVERAYSAYKHEVARGFETESFETTELQENVTRFLKRSSAKK